MEPTVAPEESRAQLVGSLWWVTAAMALHELEEWNIASWTARNFTNPTGISDQAVWIGLVVVTAIFAGWILAATRLHSPVAIAIAALPPVGLVAMGNSVQHITWTLLFSEYAPGVASVLLLVIPTAGFALWQMLRVHRAFAPAIAVCAGLWVVAAVQVVATGRTLQPFQLVLQHFFIGVAEVLGLPGIAGGG